MEEYEFNQQHFLQKSPFDFVRINDPAHILSILENEQPRTIAIILSNIEKQKAAILLQNLPIELQFIVVKEIAYLEYIQPDVIWEISRNLQNKLFKLNGNYIKINSKNLADILTVTEPLAKKQIIEYLENNDPEIADEIKKVLV